MAVLLEVTTLSMRDSPTLQGTTLTAPRGGLPAAAEELAMQRLMFMLGVLALVSCGGDPHGMPREQSAPATVPSGYFKLRQDKRLCLWPDCGGDFYRAVNRDQTACASGAAADECYVGALELAPQPADPSTLIVQGTVVPRE